MRIINKLINKSSVIFDNGKFDRWCVYDLKEDGTKQAYMDGTYFKGLLNISKFYETDKVYNDFLKIYELTNKEIDPKVILLITNITSTYKEEHREEIELWFSIIYGGMIAEENKEFAILKKRVKHLGIYQVLKLGYSPFRASRFSYNKKWKELDKEMKKNNI